MMDMYLDTRMPLRSTVYITSSYVCSFEISHIFYKISLCHRVVYILDDALD
uniref:Uncharacterized protein n=1 Tax=Arundo donax TaxID=35708 RepID=A0A0A9BRR7_ARUDO